MAAATATTATVTTATTDRYPACVGTYAVSDTAETHPTEQSGTMGAREVTLIDINDTAAWNKYLDDEMASQEKIKSTEKIKMVVTIVATVVAFVATIVLIVTLIKVNPLAALVIGRLVGPLTVVGGMFLSAYFGDQQGQAMERIKQCKQAKKMLADRTFVQFATTELGASTLSPEQLFKAMTFFYRSHPDHYRKIRLNEEVEAFKKELAQRA